MCLNKIGIGNKYVTKNVKWCLICIFHWLFVLRINSGLTSPLWLIQMGSSGISLPKLLLGFLSLFQISLFMFTAKRDISCVNRFFVSQLWHQVREWEHKRSFRNIDTSVAIKSVNKFEFPELRDLHPEENTPKWTYKYPRFILCIR